MRKRILAGVVGIALACAACADPTPPVTPTPVAPTVTDTFTGSLTPFSTNSHPFIVNQIGGLKVTLTMVDPRVQLAVGIGTPSTTTGSCAVINTTTTEPGPTPQLSGNATVTGNFCISVSDVGNVTDTATYTIVVLHS
jgi:hypothetical protein